MRFPYFTSLWQKNKFGDLLILLKNSTLSRSELNYNNGKIKNIHYGDILIKFNDCILSDSKIIPYINNGSIPNNYSKLLLNNGDIIIADTAEDNIVGKAVEIIFNDKSLIISGLHTIPCRPIKNTFASKYLGYYLNSPSFHNQLLPLIQGIKVSSISKSQIVDTQIAYPNIKEQQKIANFLSLIDQRIETQSKIIKKTKSLKKIISYIFKFLLEVILLLVPSKILKIVTNILKLVMTIVKEVKNMVKRKNFYEISNLWKEDKRNYIKKSSYSAYLLLLENHLLPYFGKKTKIEEKDVQQFVLSKINDGLSQKSIKDIIIVLKMIVKFGVKQKLLEYTDIEIKFPSDNDKSDLEVLTKQDHKKILDYLEKHFTFKNLGIYICLSTGMRIGEVCGLRWSDIDCENGIIKVRRTVQRIYMITENDRHTEILVDTPKTKNSIRDIPMTSDLLKIMKPIRKVVNEDFYVITNENKPTEPRTYRNYYKRLLKRLQINELKFHGLRHSFATRCIESKCDYKTVSVILGHSNISTTLNLYVHPNLEQKKRCVNQMFKSLR